MTVTLKIQMHSMQTTVYECRLPTSVHTMSTRPCTVGIIITTQAVTKAFVHLSGRAIHTTLSVTKEMCITV